MRTRSPLQLEMELSRFLETCGKPQEVIAQEAGVSQASVSRISSPSGRSRFTKVLLRLCKYANIEIQEPMEKPDPRNHPVLMAALQKAWDGTEEHAQGLARVISELGKLGQLGPMSKPPRIRGSKGK